jgi:hypothetical protein
LREQVDIITVGAITDKVATSVYGNVAYLLRAIHYCGDMGLVVGYRASMHPGIKVKKKWKRRPQREKSGRSKFIRTCFKLRRRPLISVQYFFDSLSLFLSLYKYTMFSGSSR